MALLDILQYPDERLHTIAKPVENFDDDLVRLSADMLETMYAAHGIGLAATQVNVHRRIIVMDLSEEHNTPLVFVNPQITRKEGETVYEEGCLSVPGIYERVHRAEKITVEAFDQYGKAFTLDADGLLAICIQHEIDHLNGRVFVEYLSQFKQGRIRTKLKKRARENM